MIAKDSDPLNPRESYDNFGKMFCWHSRYNLGDEHDFKEPEDFLKDILYDIVSGEPHYGKPVYNFLKQGNAEYSKLEYNRSSKEWELLEKITPSAESKFYTRESYSAALKGKDVPDWFLDECLSSLTVEELMQIVQGLEKTVILS